jgi:protein-L-isoaspartate(D-aspartate) O-methyltransferase
MQNPSRSRSLTTKQRDLNLSRQYYAEELRAVANLQSEALVRAFAKVPREHFLGPGPWQILNPSHMIEESNEASYYRETADADPKHLYHNILVAIDAKRFLNNGQPAFLAILIDSLALMPGDTVLHIGCGTGYYSAIMAEVVGPKGHITAVEIDSELAARARSNLRNLSYIEVIEGDGGAIEPSLSDGILVNAGVTHPRATWLDSLRISGRLLLPLTVTNESDTPQSGQVLKITRQENGFTTSFICQTMIFPCSGARDPQLNDKLKEAFKRGDAKSVQSLRRDPHNEQESCWLHDEQFCLSKTSVVP